MRSDLENALLEIINDGTCEGFGDVEFYGKYVSLVEDYDDCDYVVTEDHLGFVYVDGPHEHIEIGAGGYYQPARRIFEELQEDWDNWQEND